MRPQNNQRRGGQRSRGGRSRRPLEYTPRPAPKKTLWQKIVAFFTGGGKPQQRPAPARTESPRTGGPRFESPRTERPSHKPEMVEVTSPKLYVGNLSFDAAESDLFELFKGVGSVQNAEIVSHKHTMKSKGFAFVTMTSVDEARRAVEVLHDQEFMGRKLVVSGAKTSDVRNSSSSYGESDAEAA